MGYKQAPLPPKWLWEGNVRWAIRVQEGRKDLQGTYLAGNYAWVSTLDVRV